MAPGDGEKFVEVILASGNAIDRAVAYRTFRGRDPAVEALLKIAASSDRIRGERSARSVECSLRVDFGAR